jgi:hypothetical protein
MQRLTLKARLFHFGAATIDSRYRKHLSPAQLSLYTSSHICRKWSFKGPPGIVLSTGTGRPLGWQHIRFCHGHFLHFFAFF